MKKTIKILVVLNVIMLIVVGAIAIKYFKSSSSKDTQASVSPVKTVEEPKITSDKITETINEEKKQGFLLPASHLRKITDKDVKDWDVNTLKFARFEIFARHGYVFNDKDLDGFFKETTWYHPQPEYKGRGMNDIELYNIDFLYKTEQETIKEKFKTNVLSSEGGANQANHGLAVERDGWIYYMNLAEGNSLYRMTADGYSDKEKINDLHSQYIEVDDQWIYYLNVYSSSDVKLYRVKKDNTENTLLSKENIYYFDFDGNYIYYLAASEDSSKREIYQINKDGSDKKLASFYPELQKLNADISTFEVKDGWVYYTSDGKPYKTSVDGKKTVKLSEDQVGNLNVTDKYIYYTASSVSPDNGGNIFRINLDGSSKTLVNAALSGGSMNVFGEYIYFSNNSDYNKLYRMKTDGTDVKKMSDDKNVTLINPAGQWIFYKAGSSYYRVSFYGNEKVHIVKDK